MRRATLSVSAVDKPADFDQIPFLIHDDVDVALANVLPLLQSQLRAPLDFFRRLSVRHVRLRLNFVLIPNAVPYGPELALLVLSASLSRRAFCSGSKSPSAFDQNCRNWS